MFPDQWQVSGQPNPRFLSARDSNHDPLELRIESHDLKPIFNEKKHAAKP